MSEIKKFPAWEDLTFANNFLFCKILESDPELCRRILEMLLHIKIDHLEQPQSERTMLETLDSKSVRFDVYVKDETRVFDIEIQTTNNKNLPKRARYYQSVIDLDNLSQGENYNRLKDSYVIFLCLDSPFKKKRPVYFFENICRDDSSIKLNDRAFKLFFNAGEYAKMEEDEEKSFFKFLAGQKAESKLTKSIEEKVNFAKKDMVWRKQYMTWQQTIDEEKELAFEEGKTEKAIEDAENLLRMRLGTVDQIAQATNLPLEKVQKLAENISVNA
ncbi:MAG: Rpn family recombination-promoting nuclease/putative transposase [Treponema sp.]|nr:Rpn family recombination-promoting nuclease/putative transposase [Treponema sp.]